MSEKIIIADRIKESSYSSGTGNFELFGAFTGFSTFSSAYSYGDTLFYAITDGSSYEIGSGVFSSGVTNPEIVRFPLRSTNNNNLVSFAAGTKEVYVTYPATHAVYTGQGVSGIRQPNSSGVAFWSSEHILNYDSSIVWDDINKRLGIHQQNPSYAIDIGGITTDSIVRASGFIVGESGVFFPAGNGYAGGTQLIHFEKNQLDQYAYDNTLIPELTGTSSVFELSGVVNQFILFKQQNAGTFFAGPESGCISPCGPAYPYFRSIGLYDLPFVSDISGVLQTGVENLESDLNQVSGVLQQGVNSINDTLINVSGILSQDLAIASGSLQLDIHTISGVFRNDLLSVSGSIIDTNTTNIYDLGILSGSTNIDWTSDKKIQTCQFDGTTISLNKGTGWTTSSTDSRDVFLIMSGATATTVSFDLVNNRFYNKPEAILQSGEHSVIFRSFGSNINGYYIGNGITQ